MINNPPDNGSSIENSESVSYLDFTYGINTEHEFAFCITVTTVKNSDDIEGEKIVMKQKMFFSVKDAEVLKGVIDEFLTYAKRRN